MKEKQEKGAQERTLFGTWAHNCSKLLNNCREDVSVISRSSHVRPALLPFEKELLTKATGTFLHCCTQEPQKPISGSVGLRGKDSFSISMRIICEFPLRGNAGFFLLACSSALPSCSSWWFSLSGADSAGLICAWQNLQSCLPSGRSRTSRKASGMNLFEIFLFLDSDMEVPKVASVPGPLGCGLNWKKSSSWPQPAFGQKYLRTALQNVGQQPLFAPSQFLSASFPDHCAGRNFSVFCGIWKPIRRSGKCI